MQFPIYYGQTIEVGSPLSITLFGLAIIAVVFAFLFGGLWGQHLMRKTIARMKLDANNSVIKIAKNRPEQLRTIVGRWSGIHAVQTRFGDNFPHRRDQQVLETQARDIVTQVTRAS